MGLSNKIVGYVYLVDSNYKIRWAGSGMAQEQEVESLRTATAILLKRQQALSRAQSRRRRGSYIAARVGETV
jgi:hypothetical protein